ncbi:MAG: nucleotide exchange factor GrpE [Candidatus Binatia bacterium]
MNEKDTKESAQPDEGEEKLSTFEQDNKEESSPSEIEKLRQDLAAKELEAKKNYDLYLRQVADLENFKKRVAREKEEAIRYGNEALVKDLLPVLDNLERAVEHAELGGNGKPLLAGIELVLKGFLEVLEKHGVTQISAKGEPFNPQKHEAFAQVESTDHEPNTVVEELHKGYFMADRLLRPSLVSVAKLPETKEENSEQTKNEKNETDD